MARYSVWGEFLKKNRKRVYRSAREFCARAELGISYPQYSRYEAGDQLPSLEQALSLCRILEVPLLEGLLEWNRAQIPDASLREQVEALLSRHQGLQPAATAPVPAPSQQLSVPLDDVIVFNRSHLKLFSSDPAYRDIFTYINSCAPDWIAVEELAQALELDAARVEKMAEELNDLGVIVMSGSRCRASKSNFYFPDDEDFFHLRNMNLIHNVTRIMRKLKHEDVAAKRAFRGLITRELTTAQVAHLATRIDGLIQEVIAQPETRDPDTIYSICILMGESFSRPWKSGAPGAFPGLKRESAVDPAQFEAIDPGLTGPAERLETTGE